jgi:uncharacterized repeat protein (TIGR03803 family)
MVVAVMYQLMLGYLACVLRRAEIAQARMRLVGDAFQQRGGQPRFADPSLADAAGDLFGTTASGGAYGGGTVFEIATPAPATPARRLHWSASTAPTGQTRLAV